MSFVFAVSALLVPLALGIIFLPLLNPPVALPTLLTSLGFSLLGFVATLYLIPVLGPLFVQRGLKGRDRLKRDGSEM